MQATQAAKQAIQVRTGVQAGWMRPQGRGNHNERTAAVRVRTALRAGRKPAARK